MASRVCSPFVLPSTSLQPQSSGVTLNMHWQKDHISMVPYSVSGNGDNRRDDKQVDMEQGRRNALNSFDNFTIFRKL